MMRIGKSPEVEAANRFYNLGIHCCTIVHSLVIKKVYFVKILSELYYSRSMPRENEYWLESQSQSNKKVYVGGLTANTTSYEVFCQKRSLRIV